MREVPQRRVHTVILGGGQGKRLYPLTRDRAKPAVPLGGKYRLIDVPLSNAINSGFRDIAVLTQFNSASLNNHISLTYRFDSFARGGVEVIAAQQTEEGGEWFEGTADAVRKHMRRLGNREYDHVLILAGDHLYRMDYREMFDAHIQSSADITVGVLPVSKEECAGFGVLLTASDGQIRAFREKPKTEEELAPLAPSKELRDRWGLQSGQYLASMGVYFFRMETLRDALANPSNMDFGRDILPALIGSEKVQAFPFRGYWRDIGTIRSFYEANLALTDDDPPFHFYHPDAPIYTRPRFVPASTLVDVRFDHCRLADGVRIHGAEMVRSVIGQRARIEKGCRIIESILMGADDFEDDDGLVVALAKGVPPIGIGAHCVIEKAIVDKNARIGAGCVLRGDPSRPDQDGDGWCVRDGIVIVPKNAVLQPGTVV
jgi:glucose-1-phosphate adenylyltransferase